jgi:hypothetical protein
LKLITGKWYSKLFFIITIGYFLLWVANILFLESIEDMNANSAVLEYTILLLLCMTYFLQLAKRDEILYFQKLPTFWIVSGFLVYCALSLLIQMSYKYFVAHGVVEEAKRVWPVMFVAIIAKFVLISVGLLCYKRSYSSRPLLLL